MGAAGPVVKVAGAGEVDKELAGVGAAELRGRIGLIVQGRLPTAAREGMEGEAKPAGMEVQVERAAMEELEAMASREEAPLF